MTSAALAERLRRAADWHAASDLLAERRMATTLREAAAHLEAVAAVAQELERLGPVHNAPQFTVDSQRFHALIRRLTGPTETGG